ncbi:MAG: TM2 domain-containing protein [Paludibacteraceae bacterium]|nr:TM2 domain-containing protein [Paludibacteraceae bacterium]
MVCPNCGLNIADDNKFCPQCGTPLYRTFDSYNADKVNMFFMSHNDKLPESQITLIKEKLMYLDEKKWNTAYSVQYKDPIVALLLSFFLGEFGIDRFYIGQTGLGVVKLLTCGGFGIWAIIDLFLIMEATRVENANKLLNAIA